MNPYRDVHARIRAHEPRHLSWILSVVASALAMSLARPVLMGFLDAGLVTRGVEAVSFRVAVLVACVMLLSGFSDLVRGPDRPVLDPHPIQPRLLVAAIAWRTLRAQAYLPACGAVLLLPLGLAGYWLAWAGSVVVVLGAWLAALGVGSAVYLGGVWAAQSPGLAHLFDMVRGDNPRMHAAFIYAPGLALSIVGGAAALASAALGWALGGWTAGWGLLLLLPLLAVGGWAVAIPLSDRHYVRATALVTEIDGLYAGLESAEESRRVYLDWLAQGSPELLRALRHGWRGLRTWATGAWLLGLLGALAGWSADPAAIGRVMAVAGAAVLFVAAVPTRMAAGDPLWLDEVLGVHAWRVAGARAVAALLYAQGAILPALAALVVRQGLAAAAPLLALEILAVVGSGAAALAASRWRGQGIWAYGPLGLLLWAGAAGLVT